MSEKYFHLRNDDGMPTLNFEKVEISHNFVNLFELDPKADRTRTFQDCSLASLFDLHSLMFETIIVDFRQERIKISAMLIVKLTN